ncbi:MAG: porin [Planctomycetota bacterium]
MQRKMKTACLMAGALLAAVPGVATAETSELEQMRAEMAQMRAEMAQLKADQQGDWMSDTRRAEIEGMIADVFADANTRATLLQEGALAGIDEKGKIFLQSADGAFSANFKGQIQSRYIFNTEDGRSDESISGFQMARMKFAVKGKVGDGWGYEFKIKGDRDQESGTNDVEIDLAYITYKINDKLSMAAGAKKLPFARQELISSSRQVGVDRTLVNEFFTLNRSDLIELKYKASDDLYITGAISDGANFHLTDYNTNQANDFAVTARADWQAMGDDWSAAKDEFGGTDEDALFVGVAGHYEVADGTAIPNSGFAWTADMLYNCTICPVK